MERVSAEGIESGSAVGFGTECGLRCHADALCAQRRHVGGEEPQDDDGGNGKTGGWPGLGHDG